MTPIASFEEALSRYAEIVLVGGCEDRCSCKPLTLAEIEVEQARHAAKKQPEHMARIVAARQRVVEMYQAEINLHEGTAVLAAEQAARAAKAEAEAARVEAVLEETNEWWGKRAKWYQGEIDTLRKALADAKP